MKNTLQKQIAVIKDLFSGELDEQAVLDKHHVSRNLYNKWLANERFARQFNDRIAGFYRESGLMIARYAPLAAAKLVQLTSSDGQETARKACLDIISMGLPCGRLAGTSFDPARLPRGSSVGQAQDTPAVPVDNGSSATDEPLKLSPQTAGRLLAVLAEEKASEGR